MTQPEKSKPKLLIDNQTEATKLHKYLASKIKDAAKLRIVSAYFTIYGFEQIKKQLSKSKQVDFLYGDPRSVEKLDPSATTPKIFQLTDEGNKLELKYRLQQKALAKECSEWIKSGKVNIRSTKGNFLHGKMYSIVNQDNKQYSVAGSSNLTKNGLGGGKGSNIEINLATEGKQCTELEEWFDNLWQDESKVVDVKDEVLKSLARLYIENAPEFVYYKTLYEIFKDRLAQYERDQTEYTRTKFDQTQIYQKLYHFQQDAVSSLLYKLEHYNGCILADSVGLGKTFTALAVIKYYELKNKNVLVLCPKKLSTNWRVYADTSNSNNPFKEDKFAYKVLNHTDLSRVDSDGKPYGESSGINLANFTWGAFDLVVIDESHNFRNSTPGRLDKNRNVRIKSRYERLLEDIIKDGSQTKVMMLSATPINNSTRDLRNQLYLMGGGEQKHFKDLGINNLESFFSVKEGIFTKWLKSKSKDKNTLYEKLGGDFFDLIAAVSLARSRKQIERIYKDDMKGKDGIGSFPKRSPVDNKYPHTDTEKQVNYKKLYEMIGKLTLALYMPTSYLLESSEEYKRRHTESKFKQTDREEALIDMMRVNLLKRLESSAEALKLTLDRIIERSQKILDELDKYNNQIDVNIELNNEGDTLDPNNEDEDFIEIEVGKQTFKPGDMRPEWRQNIEKDMQTMTQIRNAVKEVVDNDRDAKLKQLKQDITEKIKKPTTYKDGKECRKILIFTAFSDTAEYLYNSITKDPAYQDTCVALVTGSKCNAHPNNQTDMNVILNHFAPIGRSASGHMSSDSLISEEDEINIVIATDCISEGQNLPDCDRVINYDIHWNPARLLQRFGRVDRIGSPHSDIQMINYWPIDDLETYLNLENRVKGRMALIKASANSDEDILSQDSNPDDVKRGLARIDEQLKKMEKMENGGIDIMDEEDISLVDFSIEEFITLLWNYMANNRESLEAADIGLYAVTDNNPNAEEQKAKADKQPPGIIFCLKQIDLDEEKRSKDQQTSGMKSNLIYPYYLVYLNPKGEIIYKHTNLKGLLSAYNQLANGKEKHEGVLCDIFNKETDDGKSMESIDILLAKSVNSIENVYAEGEGEDISNDPDAEITGEQEGKYELISWLYVYPEDTK